MSAPVIRPDPDDIVRDEIKITATDGGTLGLTVLRASWSLSRAPTPAVRPPLLCLPGHTRNASLFEPFARAALLREGGPELVGLFDYRGRGRSTPRSAPDDHTLLADASDVLAIIDAMNWHHVDVVGLARGGMVATVLAPIRPGAMRRVVLGDIGPELDGVGVARLRLAAMNRSAPADWADALEQTRRDLADAYPALGETDFELLTRATWTAPASGQPLHATTHAHIQAQLAAIDPATPLATLWQPFRTLADAPLLLLASEHSDMLAGRTIERMQREAADMTTVRVAGMGHPPLPHVPPVLEAIETFLTAGR